VRLGSLVLGLALAFAGPAECDREPPVAPSAAIETPAEPIDALTRRLGRARQRLRERGYEETGWSRRLFLPAGAARAETVRIRRGVCTTFLALAGGAVQELELVLYDSDGRRAAVDSVRGEGSLVHSCPLRALQRGSADALYYLKARTKGGAGAVAIRAFESQVGSAAGVEGVFEGILAPPDEGDGVATRLGRTLDRLRSRHMTSTGPPVIGRVLEGEALKRTVTLESARCYVAIARGEGTVRDLALYLFDPTGAEVARDLEGRDEPRVEHCADTSGSYLVEARSAEGSGDVGLALVLDPSAEPAIQALAPTEANAESTNDAPDLVPAAVAALLERGYQSPRYLVRAAGIRPGETIVHEVTLGAGCSVLLAAPESADMDLDLYLAGAASDVTASDTRITSEARLATCRAEAEPTRATVKAYGRDGTYALVMLDAPEGATDVRRVRLLEATAPFVARRYELDRVADFALGEGEERTFPIEALAGTCFVSAAAGGQSLDDIDLAIRAEDGRVLASDTGPDAWASVSRCVDEDSRFELRVMAYRGAGTVLLQTMRRSR
jgi:hypothetical protein